MKKMTLLMICLFATTLIQAQWNSDTAVNTLVASAESDDIKSVTTADGETYIVFWEFVGGSTNYELRMQVLDAQGNKQLGDNGSLISNTLPMSTSTQQWFLSLDKSDNILVGVTGTVGNIGFAFKLDINGNHIFPASGVNLGVGYTVRTLALDSGETIVTWLGNDAMMQKYDSVGNPVWTNPVTIASGSAPAQSFELADGSFVNIYHELVGGINSRMYAQRFSSADGSAIWSSPTQLFSDTYATSFINQYSMVQDEDVIYVSYKLSHNSRFDAYIQRINSDGTLPWGITGVDFDTNETNFEQENQIAFNEGGQSIFMLCRYTNASQGQSAAYIQKFDKTTGARQFTDNALELYPLSATGINNLSGDFILFDGQPMFLTTGANNSLNINLLDETGNFIWTEQSKPFATYNASKTDVNLHPLSSSEVVGTFIEDKGSGNQIFAQNFTDEALSIDTVSTENAVSFINPITNELRIKSNSTIESFQVINALGQVIITKKNNRTKTLNINSSDWHSGLYFVSILTGKNTKKVLKIIKK